MELIKKIDTLISERSPKVDCRPILPPSRQLAQIIAAYSNCGGGYIVLGAKLSSKGKLEVPGLSMDFNANPITHKALDYLSPQPNITFGYHPYHRQQVFVLSIPSSGETVLLQGKTYIFSDRSIIDKDEITPVFNVGGSTAIKQTSDFIQAYTTNQTLAKSKVLAHFQSSLKIIDNLNTTLYPDGINIATSLQEGKILTRILFSSIVDNFEIYLGDLLYEIWLSRPDTLKSQATVTVEQVLNCSDIEEFIQVYAREKISKMKKGSVKTFIEDNRLIRDLGIFTNSKIDDVDKILQIRHLFSHRNGIIDEQFLKHYNSLTIGEEYQLSIEQVLEKIEYLSETIELVDRAAIQAHNLLTF